MKIFASSLCNTLLSSFWAKSFFCFFVHLVIYHLSFITVAHSCTLHHMVSVLLYTCLCSCKILEGFFSVFHIYINIIVLCILYMFKYSYLSISLLKTLKYLARILVRIPLKFQINLITIEPLQCLVNASERPK